MDYEKKYKEALEKARKLYNEAKANDYMSDMEDYENIFPELAESEDERIRKELIAYFEENDENGYVLHSDRLRWVAWLEKYKYTEEEMKTILQTEYEKGRADVIAEMQKPADKVEPKFHVGDWCIDNEDNTIFQIVKVLDNTYTYKTKDGGEYSCTHYSLENDARFWTIQDAKDGDVLASNHSIFIFSREYMAGKPEAHCGIMNGLFIVKPESCWTNEKYYPATKEQRDLLFQKMREAGYEWNAESRKLKKIHVIDEGKSEMDYCFTKMMNGEKINPAWSEEDERMIERCIVIFEKILKSSYVYAYTEDCLSWIKSLKERIGNFDYGYKVGFSAAKHNQWRPSDEQMECLSAAIEESNENSVLESLYQDLKKLREE